MAGIYRSPVEHVVGVAVDLLDERSGHLLMGTHLSKRGLRAKGKGSAEWLEIISIDEVSVDHTAVKSEETG